MLGYPIGTYLLHYNISQSGHINISNNTNEQKLLPTINVYKKIVVFSAQQQTGCFTTLINLLSQTRVYYLPTTKFHVSIDMWMLFTKLTKHLLLYNIRCRTLHQHLRCIGRYVTKFRHSLKRNKITLRYDKIAHCSFWYCITYIYFRCTKWRIANL